MLEDGSCSDIDECDIDENNCDPNTTECKNVPGSYTCQCVDGFEKVTKKNEYTCYDINECTNSLHECKADSTCNNVIGGYSCDCNDGYNGDGKVGCKSVNECSGTHNCHELSTTCIELDGNKGKYECKCREGFEKDANNKYACKDINECTARSPEAAPCHGTLGTCTNTQGSYKCQCKEGYKLGEQEIRKVRDTKFKYQDCTNIDECIESSDNNCDTATTDCVDAEPGYKCKCKQGFMRELTTSMDTCVPITCKEGFRYSKEENDCLDIDECKENSHICQLTTTECVNTPGGFKCDCKPGMKKQFEDSKTECVEDEHNNRILEIAKMHKDGYKSVIATGLTLNDCPKGWLPTGGGSKCCKDPWKSYDSTTCSESVMCEKERCREVTMDKAMAKSYTIHYKIVKEMGATIKDAETLCKEEQKKYNNIPIDLPDPKNVYENSQFYEILSEIYLEGIWLGHIDYSWKRLVMMAESDGMWSDTTGPMLGLMCAFVDYTDLSDSICTTATMYLGSRPECDMKLGQVALMIDGNARSWIQPALNADQIAKDRSQESYEYCLPRSEMLSDKNELLDINIASFNDVGVCFNDITVTDQQTGDTIQIDIFGDSDKPDPKNMPVFIMEQRQSALSCQGQKPPYISSVDITMKTKKYTSLCDDIKTAISSDYTIYKRKDDKIWYVKTFKDPSDNKKLLTGTIEEARAKCQSESEKYEHLSIYLPVPRTESEFNELNTISDFFCKETGCADSAWIGYRRDGLTDSSSAIWKADDGSEMVGTEGIAKWWTAKELSPQHSEDDISVFFKERSGLEIYSPNNTNKVKKAVILCAFADRPMMV
jgi:hypothetical protein